MPPAHRDPGQAFLNHAVGVDDRVIARIHQRIEFNQFEANQIVLRAGARIRGNTSLGINPPGSGVPVPGVKEGSSTSISKDT